MIRAGRGLQRLPQLPNLLVQLASGATLLQLIVQAEAGERCLPLVQVGEVGVLHQY